MAETKQNRPAAGSARPGIARATAIPLYHQIYLTLRDEIISGARPFGAAVPTEMELAEAYGVSRITARRALDELAHAGFVERRRRLGTHVTFRAPAQPIESDIDQAVESLIAFGQNTRVTVLEVGAIPAPADIAAKLGLAAGEPVVRAIRLRSGKAGPLGLIVSHMRDDPGIAITAERLTDTPILSLLVEAGVGIGGAVQTIGATIADPLMASRLQCEPRDPILHIERLVEDRQGRMVLMTNAYYRADRYRITIDMHTQSQLSPGYS